MSLVRACSSSDSVSLYQQIWETRSLLSLSGLSTLCRQAFLLQGRCTEIWPSDLPPGRRLKPETGPVPEAVSFFSPHSHLCKLVSGGSRNQDSPPGAPAKPSQVGRTPLLWQGRCPDGWSLKPCLPQKLRFLQSLRKCYLQFS